MAKAAASRCTEVNYKMKKPYLTLTHLKLTHVEQFGSDAVWLRYEV